MTSNNHFTSQGKSRGKFILIIVAISAIAVLGLLLSQMDGRIVIVTSGAATATGTAASIPVIPSLTDIAPTSVENISPSATAEQIMQGERLEICESDICIIASDGRSVPLGLTTDHQIYPGFGFSPDGSKVVFNACLKTELQQNPAYQFCHELFIADRNGNVSRLTNTYNLPESHPSWSPDGEWIAIGGWSLSLIRPDGTGLTTLISDTAVGNAHASAWSPNSEQITFISGNHDFNINWGFQNVVSIINRDGSGWRKIFELPEPKPIQEDWITEIAWSPDEQSLAITFHDGRAFSIDVNCEAGKDGCRLSELTAIPEIPQNWLDTFYPQWNGAPQNTFTPTLNPQAEQARAFAEPILQVIANRPPDFEDDFGNPGNGWSIGSNISGKQGYADGMYFITADPASADRGPMQNAVEIPAVQVADFVLEMDVSFNLMQPSSEEEGGFYVHFPVGTGPPERYGVEIDLDRLVFLEKETTNREFIILARVESDLNWSLEHQHLQIVVKGMRIAVFVGEDVAFLVEAEALGSDKVSLGVINNGSLPLTVSVDNLKIWDISDLP